MTPIGTPPQKVPPHDEPEEVPLEPPYGGPDEEAPLEPEYEPGPPSSSDVELVVSPKHAMTANELTVAVTAMRKRSRGGCGGRVR